MANFSHLTWLQSKRTVKTGAWDRGNWSAWAVLYLKRRVFSFLMRQQPPLILQQTMSFSKLCVKSSPIALLCQLHIGYQLWLTVTTFWSSVMVSFIIPHQVYIMNYIFYYVCEIPAGQSGCLSSVIKSIPSFFHFTTCFCRWEIAQSSLYQQLQVNWVHQTCWTDAESSILLYLCVLFIPGATRWKFSGGYK